MVVEEPAEVAVENVAEAKVNPLLAPTVHAAPASAYAQKDKANAGLGSAVIAPPPNYGTGGPPANADSPARRGERNKSWNAEEEDLKFKERYFL